MAFNRFGSGGGRGFTPRPMVQGNWKCDDCGKEITQLPFQPKQGLPLRCKDCHLAFKNQGQ